jgi:hypothetical protein
MLFWWANFIGVLAALMLERVREQPSVPLHNPEAVAFDHEHYLLPCLAGPPALFAKNRAITGPSSRKKPDVNHSLS